MKLQRTTIEVLRQLIAVTEELSQEDYTQPLTLLFNNTLGKHIRHILEFYDVLVEGYAKGYLNYDHRGHSRDLENSRTLALGKMNLMLQQVFEMKTDKYLELTASYAEDTKDEVAIRTTFYRELTYNIEHAIHHMAIIRIAIEQHFPHIILPENFGVAYSTVRYQRA